MTDRLIRALVLLHVLIGRGYSQSYSIQTFAGTDILNDGGSALSSLLRQPNAVAVGADGTFFVSDIADYRLRKIDLSGIISTYAGIGFPLFGGDGGPANTAGIDGVSDISVGATGNVYLADRFNNRVRKITPAGAISTIAGNGNYSYSGDEGPATAAQLDANSVAIDNNGGLYVGDTANYRIRKITVDGIIHTLAGTGTPGLTGNGGPANLAQIDVCTSIAVDGAGNVYLTDFQNNYIRKITPAGIISTVAGNGSFHFSGDGGSALMSGLDPFAIAVNAAGDIYIADRFNDRVRKISASSGTIQTVAGNGTGGYAGDGGPAVKAMLADPSDVYISASGELYITDEGNQRVRKVSTDGTITTVAGSSVRDGGSAANAYLNFPAALAADKGNVYIADSGNNRVRKVDASGNISTVAGSGEYGFEGDSGQAISAQLAQPGAVALDKNGNVVIADTANMRIRKVTPDGTITTIAGTGSRGVSGDGGNATLARIGEVGSIATDTAGNVYLADVGFNRIRKITTDGVITTIAGTGDSTAAGDGGPATAAGLIPISIALDHGGSIYVADGFNNRIRKIDGAGVITTVVGTGEAGDGGDGGPATAAQLGFPSSVAVDGNGNLYIADAFNFRVRRVSSTGVITAIAGNGEPVASGDGGPAISAGIAPFNLTVDEAGNVFVSDPIDGRVRKLTPLIAARLVLASGDGQIGNTGTQLAKPLVVTITDAAGLPVAGVTVNFVVTSGAATLSAPSAVSQQDGSARIVVTLGSTAGPVVVTASASVGSAVFHATIEATSGGSAPVISTGGVVGAGLSVPAVTALSTNGMASIFGNNFAPVGTIKQIGAGDLVNGKLPTTFQGVCVEVGSERAPIFAVLQKQINFQSPKVAASGTTMVHVITGCGTSNEVHSAPVEVTVRAQAPEFFYFRQSADGKNPIAAVDAITGAYIGAPGLLPGATFVAAKAGQIVSLFFTGGGDTNPSFAPGELPDKIAGVIAASQVTVGGLTVAPADVLYVGVAPHNAGLYQLNLRLPKNTPNGDQPVILTIGGVPSSAGGFITVQGSAGAASNSR